MRRLLQDQLDSSASPVEILKAMVRSIVVVRHAATALFRMSQIAGEVWAPLGSIVKQVNHVWTGADLAYQAEVGPGLILYHPTGVVWGTGVTIGARCHMQQGVSIGGRGGPQEDGFPIIGDDCHLGAGTRILGPLRLGSGSTVAANAVVLSSFGENSTLVGAPARLVQPR